MAGTPSAVSVTNRPISAPVAANGIELSRISGWIRLRKVATMIRNTSTMASSMATPSSRNASAWSSLAPPRSIVTPAGTPGRPSSRDCTVWVSAPRSSTSGVAVRVTARMPSIWVTALGVCSVDTLAMSDTRIGFARTSAMSPCSSARSDCASASSSCSSPRASARRRGPPARWRTAPAGPAGPRSRRPARARRPAARPAVRPGPRPGRPPAVGRPPAAASGPRPAARASWSWVTGTAGHPGGGGAGAGGAGARAAPAAGPGCRRGCPGPRCRDRRSSARWSAAASTASSCCSSAASACRSARSSCRSARASPVLRQLVASLGQRVLLVLQPVGGPVRGLLLLELADRELQCGDLLRAGLVGRPAA